MLQYRAHDSLSTRPRMRVWAADWPHDSFEILTADEFEALQRSLQLKPLSSLVYLTPAIDYDGDYHGINS